MTHTLALMDVSASTFAEIEQKLKDAGYDHAVLDDGNLDMTGIALVRLSPVPMPDDAESL